jgi:hypothetical protein
MVLGLSFGWAFSAECRRQPAMGAWTIRDAWFKTQKIQGQIFPTQGSFLSFPALFLSIHLNCDAYHCEFLAGMLP